ncbi:LacI family DNA-binding transcriptional regulator [Streptomyces sp. VRA16 Mangrove soil]|uniref:LacI family DNA-binding transcriptional regulator n=1 Tax=Streptomyces sp. VRA16 Mangrove soil TaxID=2817434 RepID=UPI001A9E91ED|nr:LacI family DNA-binding transcriptional regulator [Streptomyces sp. VRA16 Mangrove soil]MBO1330694.1 LacI family DNA-binding transcriptional regulator [Streptomyces sp. VRA16 Mangrove soil]
MATIQDVAKAAGVSAMTVSNVLNDRPNVRPATRQKVLDAIARLDYRVNVAARNLRKGRTGTIGLAVPEVNRPYYGRLASAIIAAAGRHGLRVSIEQTDARRENELAALSQSRTRVYDGVILAAAGLSTSEAQQLKAEVPVVVLGERIFGGPVDHVAMPNVEASRAATRHLVDQGCRHIAFLCGAISDNPEDVDVSSLRRTGYRQALLDAGLPADRRLEYEITEFTMAAGAEWARTTAASRAGVDGVFCVTDTVAMGVLRGFADGGLRVPQDVKVIGFDNVDESAFLVPSLSTVAPDHDVMAERAVDFLVRRIEEPSGGEPEEFVAPYDLVARESTTGGAQRGER